MKSFQRFLASALTAVPLTGCVDSQAIREKYEPVAIYDPAPDAPPRFDRLTALEVADGALATMLAGGEGGGPCVGGAEVESLDQQFWAGDHSLALVQRMSALTQSIRIAGYALDGEALEINCVNSPPIHLAIRSSRAPLVTSYSDAMYATGSAENRPYWVQLIPADGYVRKFMGLQVKGDSGVTSQRSRQVAVDFVDAWHALATPRAASPSVDPAFKQAATQFRAGPDRQLPEEARKPRVLAEEAVREKKLIAAAKHYGSALEIAPWWPAGRFNRALILAELKLYPEAVADMQRYLLLVPDAANARTAQDKIYLWESKSQ